MRIVLFSLIAGPFIGAFIVFAGEPRAPEVLPEDSVKIEQVKRVIPQILRQTQIFFQDRGAWPESVDELVELKYVTLDSAVTADWWIRFTGNSFLKLCAQQKYLAKNANTVSLPDFHRICYDVETGMWHGSGVPGYHFGNLTKAQEHELAVGAQSQVLALVKSADVFYQDRGAAPSVVSLVKSRYAELPMHIRANWDIKMYGFPIDSVVAVSTQWMPDGEGKRFVYYPPTQTWSGYGVLDSMQVVPSVPYLEYVEPAKKSLSK